MGVFRRRYSDGRFSKDWYASWYEGCRQRKMKIGPSKRVAELFLKDIDLKRVRGELLGIKDEKKILFPELTEKYIAWAKGRKAEHSMKVEESAIARFNGALP